MIPWPFVPLARMTESLAWLTDALRAYTAEQRIALRSVPEQTFAFEHDFGDHQAARAQALAEAVGVGEVGVPVWTEHTRVGAVADGTLTLACDTQAQYVAGGWALLWDDDSHCEAVEIDMVNPGEISLVGGPVESYADAIVCPLLPAFAPDGLKRVRSSGRDDVRASITFLVDSGADWADESAMLLYRGLPVLAAVPVLEDGLEDSVQRAHREVGNETARVWLVPTTSQTKRSFTMRWDLATRAELWALRQWLHARKGRQRAFWLPTWARDLEPLAGIGAAAMQIRVRAIGWVNASPSEAGDDRDIMIRTVAGALYYRRVTAVDAGGAGEELLTIDSALGSAIALAEIDRVSFVYLARQSADRIEIEHQAGLGAACSVTCETVPEFEEEEASSS